MKKIKIMGSIFMLAVSVVSMSAVKKSGTKKTSVKKMVANKVVKKEIAVGMANPASVYCVEQGGESILVKSKKGDFGVCRLKDGTAVEEWEYYRENNNQKYKIQISEVFISIFIFKLLFLFRNNSPCPYR